MFLIYYDKDGRRVRAPCWFYAMLALMGIGILLGYTARFGLAWSEAQAWSPVAAKIEALSVVDIEDRESSGTEGLLLLSETSRAEIKARFTYRYDGKAYKSERVFAFSPIRDTSETMKLLYSDLNSARINNEDVPAYVPQHSPGMAVLERSVVWVLYWFLSLFGLIVLTISALGIYDKRYGED